MIKNKKKPSSKFNNFKLCLPHNLSVYTNFSNKKTNYNSFNKKFNFDSSNKKFNFDSSNKKINYNKNPIITDNCRTLSNKRKRLLKLLICTLILIISISFFNALTSSSAENQNNSSEIEQNLNNNINNQLSNIDLNGLNEILSNLPEKNVLFENLTFKDRVLSILNGNHGTDFSSIFKSIVSLVFGNITKFLPTLFIVLGVSILGSLLSTLKCENNSNGVSDLIHFITFSLVIIILSIVIKDVIAITESTTNLMKKQMDIIFPITLTLLTTVGGMMSVGVYKPVVAILSNGVSVLFSAIVLPIFTLSFIFIVLGNISPNIKLSKFTDLLSSIFKWIIGFIFTIFGAFLTVKGITAGKYDTVSFKATKFAIKSYIPIIGSYISEGLDFVILSSVLIKNAIGLAGLFIIFITVLSPILQILVLKFGLQLISAILESVSNIKYSNFYNNLSKILLFPIVLIIGVAFMYLLSLSLIMCTGNILS